MSEINSPPMRPSEALARDRVGALLDWAAAELELAPSSFGGCAPELIRRAARAQGLTELDPAHEELLLRAGGGGPGGALEAIFGSDLVGVDAMIGRLGAAPMRTVGLELVEGLGYELDDIDIVIRVRPGVEVEFVVAGSPDPPVWAFIHGIGDPVLRHPSFTEWLGHRIVRAVKRRYPLRRVVVPALSATGPS